MTTANRELVSTRIFDAPPQLVHRMFTDPKHVVNWWGPYGFRTTVETMDVRPAGEWNLVMRGPDGRSYPNKAVFLEVVPGERIVYDHISNPRFQVTMTFEPASENRTKFTMRMVFAGVEERDTTVKVFHAGEGQKETIQRLAEEIAGQYAEAEFVITHTFNAPRDLVFQAWTQPEHLAHWWNPARGEVRIERFDLRPGGIFHYCQLPPGGEGPGMWGIFSYREIDPPARLVFVSSFADDKGNPVRIPVLPVWPLGILNTVTFEASGGQTIVTLRAVPVSENEAERNAFRGLRDSMQGGFAATFGQLDKYLQTTGVS